jgi:hypothetical protein
LIRILGLIPAFCRTAECTQFDSFDFIYIFMFLEPGQLTRVQKVIVVGVYLLSWKMYFFLSFFLFGISVLISYIFKVFLLVFFCVLQVSVSLYIFFCVLLCPLPFCLTAPHEYASCYDHVCM